MAEFTKRARELVKEMINFEADNLPPFNEDLMRQALREVEEHDQQMQHLTERQQAAESAGTQEGSETQQQQQNTAADAAAYVIHYESVARIKRLLLSYMLQRFDRLKAMRWEHRRLPADIEPKCSPQEIDAYKAYDRILTKYMNRASGIGHDLTLESQPPRDNTVHVLVTKDAGAHMFSFGRLSLIEGALMRLPADEAEPLIKAGILQLHDRSEFL